MKVLAVGGGSGGHVTPVLAVLNQLAKLEPDLQATFVCDRVFEGQARGLMATADVTVRVRTIRAGKFRRYKHLTFLQHFTVPSVVIGNTLDIGKIFVGFLQSLWLLIVRRPDVIFAKGGYVCLPMGLAAWLLQVPLVIHDSDTRPGLTNKVLSRFAAAIATGSPLENYNYDRAKATFTGVPINDHFRPVAPERKQVLKQKLGFDPQQKLIIATGGGLGARSINQAMLRAAPELAEHAISIFDIAGKLHFPDIEAHSQNLANFKAVAFVYDAMWDVLGAADVVVARGSATFLQELAGLEKAVVIVPAKQLGDQLKNAAMYKAAGAALVVEDSPELGENDDFASQLVELCMDDARRNEIAAKLHEFARPNAATDVARLIVSAAK